MVVSMGEDGRMLFHGFSWFSLRIIIVVVVAIIIVWRVRRVAHVAFPLVFLVCHSGIWMRRFQCGHPAVVPELQKTVSRVMALDLK